MSFLSKIFRYVNENGDSLTFTAENGFVINKPVGIDSVSVQLSRASGINQVGATIQGVSVQPRAINISGKLYGDFQADNKENLISVINPDLEARLYADDWYLVVRPTSTPTVGYEERFAPFQFSLLAAYPYWRRDDTTSVSLSGLVGRFKFPWNLSRTYRFGETVQSQFINVRNPGQLPVPFTAVLYAKGDCKNPKITNVTTGKHILINKSMAQGERIDVEITSGRTIVTSTIDGDIRGALSLSSAFNRLHPGDNVLKPEAETGGDDLEVTIQFSEEKAGVVV